MAICFRRGVRAAMLLAAVLVAIALPAEAQKVVLGGPQGLQVKGMKIFGWSFNDNIEIGKITLSFYLSYFVVSMVLLEDMQPVQRGIRLGQCQHRRIAGRDGFHLGVS